MTKANVRIVYDMDLMSVGRSDNGIVFFLSFRIKNDYVTVRVQLSLRDGQ
jgi:hypothetical protein